MALLPNRKEAQGANDTACSLFFTPYNVLPLGLHHQSRSVLAVSPLDCFPLWLSQIHTPVFFFLYLFLSLSLPLDYFLLHSNMSRQNLALQLQSSPRSAAVCQPAAGPLLHLHSALLRGEGE